MQYPSFVLTQYCYQFEVLEAIVMLVLVVKSEYPGLYVPLVIQC